MYETLYQNMKDSLPSIKTINRSLNKCTNINEGHLRFAELKTYLLKRNLPLRVFISEDQTAILKRIQYDPKSNQMIGFLLPLCKKTGFPLTGKYPVNSVTDIENAFRNEVISNNAYVFMAQPLTDKAPAFCLAIFGSDNKFTYQDVNHRWTHLEKGAKTHGIQIEGFASDGDTRCLKTMKIRSKIGEKVGDNGQQDSLECFEEYANESLLEHSYTDCPYKSYFNVSEIVYYHII